MVAQIPGLLVFNKNEHEHGGLFCILCTTHKEHEMIFSLDFFHICHTYNRNKENEKEMKNMRKKDINMACWVLIILTCMLVCMLCMNICMRYAANCEKVIIYKLVKYIIDIFNI